MTRAYGNVTSCHKSKFVCVHVRDKVDFKALNHPSMANILSGFVTLQSTGRCVITVSFNGNIKSVGVVSQQ